MTATKRPKSTRRRKPKTLAGTGLSLDPRGIYIWRRQIDGKRVSKTTGERDLRLALQVATRFEDEYRQRKAGLKTYDRWGKALEPLVPAFVASRKAGEKHRDQYRKNLRRALADLKIVTAADLDDLATLTRRLEDLDAPIQTKRRRYQDALRQFSKWLAKNKRHLDRDPLVDWELLDLSEIAKSREAKAPMPDAINRALLALDALDVIHARKNPQRIVFTALLVSGPRSGAFVSRDVEHFDGEWIDYGEDVKKKRKGAGRLDPKTAAELRDYAADTGPLFRAARRGRWTTGKLNKAWQEAFGLGAVCHLWPENIEPDINLAHFVNQVLLKGKAPVNNGGTRVSDKTKAKRRAASMTACSIAEQIRDAWTESMVGVYVHGLRTTHRTWADAFGVHPRSIDKQLGHAETDSDETDEFTRFMVGSKTGRRHYTDKQSQLFDAGDSAKAVRSMLDRAAELEPSLVAYKMAFEPDKSAQRALLG